MHESDGPRSGHTPSCRRSTGSGPDLAEVDEICRLVLAARRLGCRVRLDDVEPELAELLDLAGLGGVVASRKPG